MKTLVAVPLPCDCLPKLDHFAAQERLGTGSVIQCDCGKRWQSYRGTAGTVWAPADRMEGRAG